MEYSIVIPAYNEANKITSTLTKVVGFMHEFTDSFEIIVSDDGSTDNTANLVEEFSKKNPEVKLLNNPHRGKAATVISGFRNAAGEYIYMCDADLSTPISELKKFEVWMKEHDYDIVIGSREGAGAVRIDEPQYRHLMGRVFNFMIKMLVVPGIEDTQCGFKLFKAGVIKTIVSKMHVYTDEDKEIDKPFFGAFDVEILYIARKHGYKIKELPVLWNYVGHTDRSLIFNSVRMALDVIKMRIYSLKGAYK